MKLKFLSILLFLFLTTGSKAQIITTVAGTDSAGYNGDLIPAIASELNHPIGIALDTEGNIYIADIDNYRIRKVNTSGIITTIAGTGSSGFSGDNGPATAAQLNAPLGIAIDIFNNVYFSDVYNQRIRRIDALTGTINTVAGNDIAGYNGDNIAASAAELNDPHGIVFDKTGNLYVADFGNNRIRKIDESGIITTYTGDSTAGLSGDNGQATVAELFYPYGIATDSKGNLYIACYNGCCVRMVNTYGIINTIVGSGSIGYSGDNGPATDAELNAIGVATDMFDNIYYYRCFPSCSSYGKYLRYYFNHCREWHWWL